MELRAGQSYSFDANGNMVGKTEGANFVTLGYDYENRLISKTGGVTKKYNALGQERGFLYDQEGKVIYDLSGGKLFVHGARGELLEEQNNSGQLNYYAFTDHQGSVRVVTDSAGNITGRANFDAWGNGSKAGSSTIGFAGARYDSGAAMYSMGARYYDQSSGTFSTRDTVSGNVWEPWTWNLYTYCKNSPQNYVDPTGHVAEGIEVPGVTGGPIPLWLGLGVITQIVSNILQTTMTDTLTKLADAVRKATDDKCVVRYHYTDGPGTAVSMATTGIREKAYFTDWPYFNQEDAAEYLLLPNGKTYSYMVIVLFLIDLANDPEYWELDGTVVKPDFGHNGGGSEWKTKRHIKPGQMKVYGVVPVPSAGKDYVPTVRP